MKWRFYWMNETKNELGKIVIISGLTGAGKSFMYGKIYEQLPYLQTLIQSRL